MKSSLKQSLAFVGFVTKYNDFKKFKIISIFGDNYGYVPK